jgi:hypothetical protein
VLYLECKVLVWPVRYELAFPCTQGVNSHDEKRIDGYFGTFVDSLSVGL